MKFLDEIKRRKLRVYEEVERWTSDFPYAESSELFEKSYAEMIVIVEELVKYIEERCIQPNEPEEEAT